MDRVRKLALWAAVGAVALATAWVVWPGVMAWRTRSEVYAAAMRQCLSYQEGVTADQARANCNGAVRP